jgi:hypothetical protein
MVRKTPLPLLRDLAPNVLVIRCQHCTELVVFDELCQAELESMCCPRRAMIEQTQLVVGPLALPLAGLRTDA